MMYPSFAPCDLAKRCSFTKVGGNTTTIVQESKSFSINLLHPLLFQGAQALPGRANTGNLHVGDKLQ